MSSTVPEYIEKIIVFLNQETAWNQSIVEEITNFLRKSNPTLNDVDSLMMTVTKIVETRLREKLAIHLGREVPNDKDYGIRLLDYAVNSHLILNEKETIYSLLCLILKEPRNSSHHTFPEYPFKTTVMWLSEANEALQRIDSLIKPKYESRLHVNYDPSDKKIIVQTIVTRPNGAFLPSDQKVDITLKFPNNSVKTVPLTYGALNTWKGEYNLRGEMYGTITCLVRGFDNGYTFMASSGSSFPTYAPLGQKCPNCGNLVTSLYISICPNCGKAVPII